MPFCEGCSSAVHSDTASSHNVAALPSDIVVVILNIAVTVDSVVI